MSDIDPVAFGALQAEVNALRRELDGMRDDIKTLVGMAERSKGAFWAGMTFAGLFGSVATWAIQHWIGKGP